MAGVHDRLFKDEQLQFDIPVNWPNGLDARPPSPSD